MAKKSRQRAITQTTEPAPGSAPAPAPTAWESITRHPRIVAGVVVAVIAAGVAIAVMSGKGSHHSTSTQPTVKGIGPIGLSAAQLANYARNLNQWFYWVGPRSGQQYEFQRTTSNYVFVRYIPKYVQPGTRPGKFLLIATYPLVGALTSLKSSPHAGKLLKVAGHKGALAAVEQGKPTNVRVAYPGVDYEVEVYDPKPSVALSVATSGELAPVG